MLRIYDVVLDVLQRLKPLIEKIAQQDADLARQLRRCATNMLLNVAEGSGGRAGTRYRDALGLRARASRVSMRRTEIRDRLDGISATSFKVIR